MKRDESKTCTYIYKNGKKCRAYKMKGLIFCAAHEPENEAQFIEFRQRGVAAARLSQNRLPDKVPSLPADPQSVDTPRTRDEILRFVQETMVQVRNGDLDHRRGDVVAKLGKLALSNVGEADELSDSEQAADAEIEKLRCSNEG